jgi:outer membrane receptor protein involved in Fe transport
MSQYLSDFTVGANATWIQSEVMFPEDERQSLDPWGAGDTRPMVDQPDVIYNLNLTYDNKDTGTTVGLFYTLTGEKLISGQTAGAEGDYIPDIYQMSATSLNLSLAQKVGKNWKISFAAKNLTNPTLEDVYRTNDGKESPYKSYKKGIEYSVSASYEF